MRRWNHVYQVGDEPGAGTDEVQTITIGGTPTGGTFTLILDGEETAPITWSSTNNTLVANIDAALGALPGIGGAANVTTAVGTMTAGIGTITVTFTAALGKQAISLMTVGSNDLTGTDPTVEVEETTPGVNASGVDQAPKGALLVDTANALIYVNTGTKAAPTWTLVGSQTAG
jgi:hypothetical protein